MKVRGLKAIRYLRSSSPEVPIQHLLGQLHKDLQLDSLVLDGDLGHFKIHATFPNGIYVLGRHALDLGCNLLQDCLWEEELGMNSHTESMSWLNRTVIQKPFLEIWSIKNHSEEKKSIYTMRSSSWHTDWMPNLGFLMLCWCSFLQQCTWLWASYPETRKNSRITCRI